MKRGALLSRLWRSRVVRAIIALAIICALYLTIDVGRVIAALESLDTSYVVAGMCLFVPQLFVSALRWTYFLRPLGEVPLRESVRATLAANAYNLVLPGKLGDFSRVSLVETALWKPATLSVVLEKVFDVVALLVFALFGLLGLDWSFISIVLALLFLIALASKCWGYGESTHLLRRKSHRWLMLVLLTLGIWTLHLVQIFLFCQAAETNLATATFLSRVPWAIFAGLIPLSLWGIGLRDAALVALFSTEVPHEKMAAVGVLTTSRYLIPGLIGIPWIFSRKPVAHDAVNSVQSKGCENQPKNPRPASEEQKTIVM